MAGESDLVLTLDEAIEPPAYVIGILADEAGLVGEQDRLSLQLVRGHRYYDEGEPDGDSFRLGPVPPGRYFLRVVAGTTTVLSTESFELAPGEEHDLGIVRTEIPGSVVADVELAPDVDFSLAALEVVALDVGRTEYQALVHRNGVFVAERIAPGRWALQVFGESDGTNVTSRFVPFEIRAGEETRVRTRVEVGADRNFEAHSPPDEADWVEIHIVVRDEEGTVVQELRSPAFIESDVFPFGMVFPRGTSWLSLTTDTGLTAAHEVVIEDVDAPAGAPTVIELR
jgi:hypothetical protein